MRLEMREYTKGDMQFMITSLVLLGLVLVFVGLWIWAPSFGLACWVTGAIMLIGAWIIGSRKDAETIHGRRD
jgi:hypothetical protein